MKQASAITQEKLPPLSKRPFSVGQNHKSREIHHTEGSSVKDASSSVKESHKVMKKPGI